ncbi:MAG: sugar phosphate isomerase/epimerase [Bryobacterales bacterium]|nr:sugar phosphate isomerase/epimerase [Bryobacterales bacterium]MBV9396837.1 sugar phosphate isomerase/epimerase [Bryobacterales bacterium]
MKLAVSNIAWEPLEEPAVREIMRRYGAAGVEIAPTKVWGSPADTEPDEVTAVRRSWAKDGFKVAALQSLLFAHPELTIFDGDAARAATEQYLEKIIQLAGRLGAGALVFGSPKNRLAGTKPRAEIEQIARGFFQRMADAAVASNTCFCLEPNPPEYGCDYVTNVNEALSVIRDIDHPGLRLNLDTGIMTMNREPVEPTIEAAFPWIGHVHLSEPRLATVGSGAVDHRRIGRALNNFNYTGWVSIEMRAQAGGTNSSSVETALRAATEFYVI